LMILEKSLHSFPLIDCPPHEQHPDAERILGRLPCAELANAAGASLNPFLNDAKRLPNHYGDGEG
jgi:hypothetical protein